MTEVSPLATPPRRTTPAQKLMHQLWLVHTSIYVSLLLSSLIYSLSHTHTDTLTHSHTLSHKHTHAISVSLSSLSLCASVSLSFRVISGDSALAGFHILLFDVSTVFARCTDIIGSPNVIITQRCINTLAVIIIILFLDLIYLFIYFIFAH